MASNNNRSKERFFLIVIFTLIAIMALRLPMDTDFWWHIRAGGDTVIQRSPVLTDQYSFTKWGEAWDNHSWLAQVVLYLVYKWFSLPGIMVLVTGIAVLSIYLIYQRMQGPVLWKAFLLVLTVLISAVIWSPRPQIFSYLFLSIEQYLLFRYENTRKQNILIWILVLFVFWSNLHAGFSIGVIYLLTWFFGILFDHVFSSTNSGQKPFRKTKLLLFIVLVFLVVMINPNGINVWLIQFKTVSVSALQDLIPEWASPNFHELVQQPFLWAWLLVVFFGLFSKSEISGKLVFPVLAFGFLGFLSRRNYGPFAVVVSPLLSDLGISFFNQRIKNTKPIQWVLKKQPETSQDLNPKINALINLIFTGLLFLILIGKYVYLSNTVIIDFYEKQMFPGDAVTWLKENPVSGNVLNEYAWGGYMLWNLPETKVFVDGRTDLFGDEIILDWLKLVSKDESYEELLQAYEIDWVFLEQDRPLIAGLEEKGWRVLYEDELSMIMKAP